MRRFGLIGRPLGHSASAAYFAAKFEREGIADCPYTLYELPEIGALERLLAEEKMDSHMKCARRRRVTRRDEEVKNVVLKEEAMKDKMVDDYCLLKWVKDYRDRVDEQIHNEVKVRLRECGEC